MRLLAFLLLLLVAAPAMAAEPCKAPPGGNGTVVRLPTPLDEADRLGFSAGVLMALGDPTGEAEWPEDVIEGAPPCPMGQFDTPEGRWSITGGEGRVPPRFVQNPASEEFLYLALGPSPAEAYAWFKAGADDPLRVTRPTFYLAAVTPIGRLVFRLYDGMPSDADLAADAKAVVEGRAPPLAIFDIRGEAVTVMMDTRSGLRAQLFAPEDHHASIFGPDGKYFQDAGGGEARMYGSGFRCPVALAGIERTRLTVLNGSDGGLDLGCSFIGEETWISLFVTRADTALERKYRDELKAAQDEGLRTKLTSGPAGMAFGEAWIDRKSAGQGLWMIRRGPYIIEARATFAPQDQGAIERAIATIALAAAEIPDR